MTRIFTDKDLKGLRIFFKKIKKKEKEIKDLGDVRI